MNTLLEKSRVTASAQLERLVLIIRGAVQGVGFRPFVFRLAKDEGLSGWIRNSTEGIQLEVEGSSLSLQNFLRRIQAEAPQQAVIQKLETYYQSPAGYTGFRIEESRELGQKSVLVQADIATCPQCLQEIFDPTDRRFRYPFTNCTLCGPRYSIVLSLPYDRASTTMRQFPMCERCQKEFEDPQNRRFHAQPNTCPQCGPQLELWNQRGGIIAVANDALLQTADFIRQGGIVAIKGIGGFQLLVDASNEEAVTHLRQRKRREQKPFALMYPSLVVVENHCRVSLVERKLLCSSESPIVLLERKSGRGIPIASSVAPGNPYLGIMLPYSPLHYLLMTELNFPVVATSGNRSDEPICTDEREAVDRLAGIADYFLVHNRPIARHVDDSIVRVIADREMVIRRARGYAPLPIESKLPLKSAIAFGAHLKNTVALSLDSNVIISQHIGDLETRQAQEAFQLESSSLFNLYDCKPEKVVCDLHPDYHSSQAAEETGIPVVHVQHHLAHVLSCLADNSIEPPILGIVWDGTGLGTDGKVWGGEFIKVNHKTWQRWAHFRYFSLPGGDSAVKEPRRSALGILYDICGDEIFKRTDLPSLYAFTEIQRLNLHKMLSNNVNCPLTSSVGRLFDGVASILDIRQVNTFEGQAAMDIEFLAMKSETKEAYPTLVHQGKSKIVIDWEAPFREVLKNLNQSVPKERIAAKFHNFLANTTLEIAKMANIKNVALTGGCFQNKLLNELITTLLEREGFIVFQHHQVPPNDGGISLGQIVAAAMNLTEEG